VPFCLREEVERFLFIPLLKKARVKSKTPDENRQKRLMKVLKNTR
jgi:hypothetical protein